MTLGSNSYQSIIESFSSGILLLDDQYRIQLWNQFMVNHSGKSFNEVKGKIIFDVFPESDQAWFREKVEEVLSNGKVAHSHWETHPFLLYLTGHFTSEGDAESMYQNCDFIPLPDAQNETVQVCIAINDTTEQALYQLKLSKTLSKLKQISREDALTELYNRGYWEGRLKEEFARCSRYAESSEMTLLMIDVDHFKVVNDRYGHLAGDEVLKGIADQIREVFRAVDILGRYGGEEFCVILPTTDISGAMIAAERLREKVGEAITNTEAGPVNVKISIGLAKYSKNMQSHEELMRQADVALYEAKNSGRDQVKVYQAE